MLNKSNRTWKCAAMLGGAAIAPMAYLYLNQWKVVGLLLACWAVIGGAAGWDLARILLGEKLAGRKRRSLRQQRAADSALFDEMAKQNREFLERMDREGSDALEEINERATEEWLQDRHFHHFDEHNSTTAEFDPQHS